MKNNIIPYSRPSISSLDIKRVVSVLKSKMLTQGKFVPIFEKLICKYVNAKYAVAVNSATSALHLSCLSLNLKKNDIVWTSDITFVSTANSALLSGAKIDLLDIDLQTNNIDLEKLEMKLKLTKNKLLPKVIIPVHMAGMPCDMLKLNKLSKKYKFKIIEDASHALGSSYKNFKVGSCKHSELTVFSFHPVKNITTGEGGIVTTNSKVLYNKIKLLRTHGITYEKKKFRKIKNSLPGYYQQINLGFNYRMSDIAAILGISQLKRLKIFLKKRNKIARLYNKHLKNLPLILPLINNKFFSAFHLYIIKINAKSYQKIRNKLFYKFIKYKFKVNIHYIPVHTHPYFKNFKFEKNKFTESNKYYKSALSIPIFPDLNQRNQKKIIKIIKSCFE